MLKIDMTLEVELDKLLWVCLFLQYRSPGTLSCGSWTDVKGGLFNADDSTRLS